MGEQLCLQPVPPAAHELAPGLLAKPWGSSVGLLGERLLVFLEDGPFPPALTRLWPGACWSPPSEVEVTLLRGGLWDLALHAEVKCPPEQRDKCAASGSSGKV